DETERILGIPVMATVDHMRKLTKKTGELVVLEKGSSEYAVNFFNTLRTNLLYSAPAEERRVLLVTSSTPEEGKTFLASNLALALANLGEEVLLIDADLRHPRVHDLFGLDKEPGLTDFLVGRNALEEVLHATGKDHLSLIPAGHHSPNPVDLLSSDRLQGLFEELQGRFQYIVVDSPPVLSVADPLTLVPGVNGVIVVTWAGRTPRRNVIQAFRKLKEVRDSRVFFGLVMNRIVHRRGSSYYYYHRRYRYYYSKSQ
ncbi:MAG: CpsD/CapB family tyrosine-protein kinase, partial [Nitrospinota bacterium]